jgi:hypothetical protein
MSGESKPLLSTKGNAMKKPLFPSIKALAKVLVRAKRDSLEPANDWTVDVRLQVHEEGGWALRTGDSSYDQDHRGYWGSSVLARSSNCTELARELINQAKNHWAESQPPTPPRLPSVNKVQRAVCTLKKMEKIHDHSSGDVALETGSIPRSRPKRTGWVRPTWAVCRAARTGRRSSSSA